MRHLRTLTAPILETYMNFVWKGWMRILVFENWGRNQILIRLLQKLGWHYSPVHTFVFVYISELHNSQQTHGLVLTTSLWNIHKFT